jgi:hypothetical protein
MIVTFSKKLLKSTILQIINPIINCSKCKNRDFEICCQMVSN